MFEKKKKIEPVKRLEQVSGQSFGELDTRILVDTETGVNYLVVVSALTHGLAVTPMYSEDNEVLVTEIQPKEE